MAITPSVAGGIAPVPQACSRCVFITRPEPQATQWCQALARHVPASVHVHALPMIDIASVDAPAYQQRLQQAWAQLPVCAAAFFVSVPAVQHFFAATRDAAAHWNAAAVRAWAPGRGTRQALLDVGVEPALIDSPPPDAAQFDSETLWPLVAVQMSVALAQGRHVLRVRGTDQPVLAVDAALPDFGAGRDWLGAQVQAHGVPVHTVVAYQRQAPQWSEAQRAHVVQWAAAPGHVWVWSSSQALAHMQRLLPHACWQGATAIVTHPRIGEAAARLGFGRIIAARPALQDVAQSIQSWL